MGYLITALPWINAMSVAEKLQISVSIGKVRGKDRLLLMNFEEFEVQQTVKVD